MSIKNLDLKSEINRRIDLKNLVLEVGFFNESKYPNGVQVAQVAKWQEFGTHKIPPRPFMRKAINKGKSKWVEVFKKNGSKSVKKGLEVMGEAMRGDIVMSITTLNTPPNCQSTIKQKGSSNPLIDTGLMRASVNFKVSKK